MFRKSGIITWESKCEKRPSEMSLKAFALLNLCTMLQFGHWNDYTHCIEWYYSIFYGLYALWHISETFGKWFCLLNVVTPLLCCFCGQLPYTSEMIKLNGQMQFNVSFKLRGHTIWKENCCVSVHPKRLILLNLNIEAFKVGMSLLEILLKFHKENVCLFNLFC